jgi:demethylmenaquinone methyltransferase/2-methoxy-6-polyprenyl-1,4-benzoquinol methylase
VKNSNHDDERNVNRTDDTACILSLYNRLTEPAIRAAIQALQLPLGSQGLDAPCGIGNHTLWLAETVGPTGQVTGLDLSLDMLAHARTKTRKSRLVEQIFFEEGDLNNLPFDDDLFDWAWSADGLWPGPKEKGFPAEDPVPLVQELARVVKPGGIVAILFSSSQKLLLPGYPLLEARLNATEAANFPATRKMKPTLHILRSLGWLRAANLAEPVGRTFVTDVQAPLDETARNTLQEIFQMFWANAESEVAPEDWAEFQRLCQPESPDFILDLPDYYSFLTCSLFYGKVTR